MDWQNKECRTFSEVRNSFFEMRDRLRAGNKKYKNTKLKTANHYWKFCFGDEVPFQSPLSSLEADEQQQMQNLFPTITKMSILTQVSFSSLYISLSNSLFSLRFMNCYNMKLIG